MPSVTQAVIPAAGLGTRFLPTTKVVPKELLPLGTKPAIAYAVDECLDAGIREICFVIRPGKELIPKYFERDQSFEQELQRREKGETLKELVRYDEVRFHVAYQDEQLGDGHALLQAQEWLRSDPFVVLFPDDLIVAHPGCLRQMVDRYDEGVLVALLDVQREEVSRYGIVDPAPNPNPIPRTVSVADLIEKPDPADAPSTLAVMGRFLLPFGILHTLGQGHRSRGGEQRIVDAIRASIGRMPVAGYCFEGTRYDLGTPEGYREAVAEWREHVLH